MPQRKKPRGNCADCGKTVKRPQDKFCNTRCSADYRYHQAIKSWLDGVFVGGSIHRVSNYVRRWLIENNGNRCMDPNCGWDWTKPCGVEVEHKDGNPLNNHPDNIMLICPNCHTNTPTYKNKNKGNGRSYRRDRYKNGLSY